MLVDQTAGAEAVGAKRGFAISGIPAVVAVGKRRRAQAVPAKERGFAGDVGTIAGLSLRAGGAFSSDAERGGTVGRVLATLSVQDQSGAHRVNTHIGRARDVVVAGLSEAARRAQSGSAEGGHAVRGVGARLSVLEQRDAHGVAADEAVGARDRGVARLTLGPGRALPPDAEGGFALPRSQTEGSVGERIGLEVRGTRTKEV